MPFWVVLLPFFFFNWASFLIKTYEYFYTNSIFYSLISLPNQTKKFSTLPTKHKRDKLKSFLFSHFSIDHFLIFYLLTFSSFLPTKRTLKKNLGLTLSGKFVEKARPRTLALEEITLEIWKEEDCPTSTLRLATVKGEKVFWSQ